MDNDYEINKLIRRESESFLNKALAQSKVVQTYDFDTEFAKTKTQKSYVVLIATCVTILALLVTSYAVTKIIQVRADNMPVDITAFDELNLKDLLDSSKRNEADLERAKLELAHISSDYSDAVALADRNYAAEVESIKAKAQSQSEEVRLTAQAAATRDAAKKRARENQASAVAAKRTEIAGIQKRIDQYDSRSLAQAKQQEYVLSNERVAFDIEKKKQADFYEARIAELQAQHRKDVSELVRQKQELAASLTLRYNPNFSDPQTSSLLAGQQPQAGKDVPFNDYLSTAGILDSSSESRLDSSLQAFKYLSGKLRSVPYINSIPLALARLEAEAESSITAYRQALSSSGDALQGRDKEIALLTARAKAAEASLGRYQAAVAALAQNNRETGYVLDARSDQLVIYLAPGVSVKEGDQGYIVRDSSTIATIAFHFEGDSVLAKVTALQGNQKPQPFDSVLVAPAKTPTAP